MRGPTATGLGKQLRAVEARLVVPFEDNRHLNRLLGEYDGHLALLEERLGIEAQAHGNMVTLTGPSAACETARDVLEKLYARIRQGEDIGPGDVDGLLRHAGNDSAPTDGLAQIRTRRRIVTARSPVQGAYIQALQRVDLVFGVGPAGTGKTYLAVAYAAQCLERGLVDRIVLSRPAVEAGERLGFLPGDMREKVDPYLRPLYDALYDVLPQAKVERDLDTGIIEIAPLAFMRGRTLAHSFVILDEAQNTTSMQMKMFLTRLGEGSKMAVTGDPSQVDLPPGQRSGLEEAVGLLSGIRGIEAVRFTSADVVRRDLVARIVDAYDHAG
ncbi:MAG TPA: PhoH family protein [Hyphomicrobiaceae bacterium]|nr:PhoH family protein [Hyphomicrobiaceae bacterium]